MKLSNAAALSVVCSLASVNALVIPNFDNLPVQFNLVKDVTTEIHDAVAKKTEALTSPTVQLLAEEDAAPMLSADNFVPNSYIIMFKEGLSENVFDFHQLWVQDLVSQSMSTLSTPEQISEFSVENGGGLKHVYNFDGTTLGYSGKFTPEVVKMLLRHPDVAHVEMDAVVHTQSAETQTGAPWGL
ncbi:unnamed protein product [Ambrosiozyma monospora]|uniref:Unnamed protein product n=1 Tax=Ambrosiozyma monospora TaxID=43982 RepID=A0ACB5TZB4_AMBMO|nr:unnamed protein product [Ambrosiozyma monospora]